MGGLARMVTKLSVDIKYLEQMLPTRKSYTYPPLRCPDFLCVDLPDDERWVTNQSSECSEDTGIKTQLKSLLNLQNKVHSLVRKNVVTEEEEGIFSQMSVLQAQYQALLARLLSKMGGAPGQSRGEGFRFAEDIHKLQTGSWKEDSSLSSIREDCPLMVDVSYSGAVTKLPLSSGQTLHPVTWQGECWVTSAEVSSLNPLWHGYDLLLLQRKKVDGKVQCLQISASTEEHLFQEMIVEGVGGLLNKKSGKLLDSVILYKLADLETIMKVFHLNIGHEDLNRIELFVNRHK